MRILVLVLLLIPNIIWAFNYPVGIPDAWISPDIEAPSPPSPWSSEITNMYYIDNSDPNCSAKVTYGSAAEPKCYIPSPLPAGSYVEIHGGPYNYMNTVYLLSEGTESEPVWIVGGDNNLIEMHIVLYGTYLYLDGLNMEGGHGISVRPYRDVQTDHIMVRNTNITGSGVYGEASTAISARGAYGLPMEGFIAYKNTISYMGDSENILENDVHAMSTGSYIHNVWHLYNISHHNGGDGVQYSHSGVDAHHFYYGGNISHDERENCVDIKQANDVVISENTCYNIESSSTSSGECMVVHYGPSRIWFINNDISECISGIVSSAALDIHIIGNNIHGMRESLTESHTDISTFQSGAAIRLYNSGSTYVGNNTITDAIRGIAYEALSGYEVDIIGNIITDLRTGEVSGNNPYAIMIKGADDTIANSDIENNLFYNPMQLYVDGATYTDLATLVADGKCDDNGGSCLGTAPSFSDNGYTLTSNSPAIDRGSISNSYSIYKTLYGKEITTDILGNDRPSTSTEWDIGAYEHITGANVAPLLTVPSAPTTIKIIESN